MVGGACDKHGVSSRLLHKQLRQIPIMCTIGKGAPSRHNEPKYADGEIPAQANDQRRNYILSPSTEGQSQLNKGQLSEIGSPHSAGRARVRLEQRRSSGICPLKTGKQMPCDPVSLYNKGDPRKVSGQASLLRKARLLSSCVTESRHKSKFNQGFPRPQGTQPSEVLVKFPCGVSGHQGSMRRPWGQVTLVVGPA